MAERRDLSAAVDGSVGKEVDVGSANDIGCDSEDDGDGGHVEKCFFCVMVKSLTQRSLVLLSIEIR